MASYLFLREVFGRCPADLFSSRPDSYPHRTSDLSSSSSPPYLFSFSFKRLFPECDVYFLLPTIWSICLRELLTSALFKYIRRDPGVHCCTKLDSLPSARRANSSVEGLPMV